MDILFVILALLCALIGLIGAVMPALPGPPLSFVALLLLSFCTDVDVSLTALIIAALFAFIVTILDYFAPVWLANKKGGSKYGLWGTTIGMFVGLFFGLPGLIICPFLGALIGELLAKTSSDKALKVAFMSFVAFMLTTGLKVIYCIALLVTIGVHIFYMIIE